jgi:hypothetical protein
MLVFEKRKPSAGIIKTSHFDSGKGPVDFGIADADNVILHCEGITVVVINIQETDDGIFTGIVLGFEPADSQVPGLAQGDEVVFEEDHVISMGKS